MGSFLTHFLAYLVSFTHYAVTVGTWASTHPEAAAFWGTAATEIVVKYSRLFNDKGLIEKVFDILHDAIKAAMKRQKA